jgi:predicted RNA-binding Zn-ribbon protein involved in translation (DUF1610 family)
MNSTTSQPPPVPCSKCGGRLARHSAFQFKCESCGAIRRRRLGAELTTVFVLAKLGFLAIAFLPSVMVLNHAINAEKFLVLNGACSLAAGLGLMARMAGWKITLLAGFGLGACLFLINFAVGVFMGCTRHFSSL